MSNFFESLNTELRISGRILRETLMGLQRTGWMNLVVVITMASILSIFGIFLAIIFEMEVFVHKVGSVLEISAYVEDAQDMYLIRDKVLQLPHIQKITLISKEKAWKEMQDKYQLPEVDNPLPDTLHIQLNHEKHIPGTVAKIKAIGGIEQVQYPKKVLDKIRGVTRGATFAGIIVSLFLGTLTLFIISNTIHLLIQAKSREIEILRMMGVGNWYIRLPFLIQGALYGLAGAIVAYTPLSIAVYYALQLFVYLGFETSGITSNFVMMILLLMGILVGSGGATFAVRKYLTA